MSEPAVSHPIRRAAPRPPCVRPVARLLRSGIAIGLALTAGLCLTATPAWGHAELVDSSPGSGQEVIRSPRQLVFTFAEEPDPVHSVIQVLGADGRPAPGLSATKPFPGNPLQLLIDVDKPLVKGVYTVNWKTVSADDGHVDNGTLLFGVRESPPKTSPFGARLGATPSWLTAASAIGRWLIYAGLALLLGCAATCLISFRGAFPKVGGRVLLRGGWLAAMIGLAVVVLAEKRIVGAPSLLPLFQTSEGADFIRLGEALGICLAAVIVVDVWPRRSTLVFLGLAAAAAMLVLTRGTHADAPATMRLFNLVDQWLHVLAVGVWVGGLAWLLLAVWKNPDIDRRPAVARFSTTAGIALAVVVATGVLRAMAELNGPRELFTTSYGRALLVKVALVVVIAALGALNRYRHVPALRRRDDELVPFERTVGGEVVVGALILAATAVLAGLAPPGGFLT